MENGDRIFELHGEVQRVQVAQKELDQNLEIIYGQQNELDALLSSLESEVENLANESEPTPTDLEREKGYQLAEDINAELDQMETTLKDMINKLNASHTTSDSDNPVNQVVKILNAHLTSLQWLDQNSNYLQSKLQELNRAFNAQKSEQEWLHALKSQGY